MIPFNVGDRVRVKRNRKKPRWLESDLEGREAVVLVKLEERKGGHPDCCGIEFTDCLGMLYGSNLICDENPNIRCKDGYGRFAMPHELELLEEPITGVLTIGDI